MQDTRVPGGDRRVDPEEDGGRFDPALPSPHPGARLVLLLTLVSVRACAATTFADSAALKAKVDECLPLSTSTGADCPDMPSWDVSAVTDMSDLFYGKSSFNMDISQWDTSSVTTMSQMFRSATRFNQPIGNWKTSAVTTMNKMFNGARDFNQDLTGWDTSSVESFWSMFLDAKYFNGNISTWDTSKVRAAPMMFRNCVNFNGDLSRWTWGSNTDFSNMFSSASKFEGGDLTGWRLGSAIQTYSMFQYASVFNGNISTWDMSNVWRSGSMFKYALAFNGDISAWDVSGVNDAFGGFNNFFEGATSFDQDITGWSATNAGLSAAGVPSMFAGATAFLARFENCAFDSTLPSCDPAASYPPAGQPKGAGAFDGPPGSWSMKSCAENERVSRGRCAPCEAPATRPAGDDPRGADTTCALTEPQLRAAVVGCISAVPSGEACCSSDPNCANALDATSPPRCGASVGCVDAPDWDVSLVTDASELFRNCAASDACPGGLVLDTSSFDVDISRWDTSAVSNMAGMFRGAASFDADIRRWTGAPGASAADMFLDADAWNAMYVSVHGLASFDGPPSEWKSAFCGADEHVRGGTCVPCGAGLMNLAGDGVRAGDTECASALCGADERVLGGACVPCEAGLINREGDDRRAGDTECEEMPCCMKRMKAMGMTFGR